jgi:ABC-type uncharacterized transport system permease subunit
MLLLYILPFASYLLAALLLTRYFTLETVTNQHLTYKTILSVIAWIGFTGIVISHKLFGWRRKLVTLSTQITFTVLVLSYFGTKFILERLLS